MFQITTIRRSFLLLLVLMTGVFTLVGGEQKDSWQSLLDTALKYSASMDRANAYAYFDKAFRLCDDDDSREQVVRKAQLLKIMKGPDLTEAEKLAVGQMVLGQQVEFLKASLAGFTAAGKIAVLNKIKEIAPDTAVYVSDAISSISHTFFEQLSDEEKAELERILENAHISKLDDAARTYVNHGNFRMAIKLYWAYIVRKEGITDEEREKTIAKINELMQRMLTEVSGEEQAKIVSLVAAAEMTTWETTASMKFIFVGLAEIIKNIDLRDLLQLDMAYMLASDMLSNDLTAQMRIPILLLNTDGQVSTSGPTVLARRLGHPINGRLDMRQYYRALTSLLGRDNMGLWSLTVGLRRACEVYIIYMLDDNRAAISEANDLEQVYRKYFAARDINFANLPTPETAAGMFLSVMMRHATHMGKVEWLKLRLALDIFRANNWAFSPRYHLKEYYAYVFGKVFGRDVYKTLQDNRFELVPESYNDFALEAFTLYPMYCDALALYNSKDLAKATERLWEIVRDAPPCPIVDQCYRLLVLCNYDTYKRDVADKIKRRLGIIEKWQTCGPFYSAISTFYNLAEMNPPETTINFGATYPNQHQVAKWKAENSNIEGRFTLSYSYPRDFSAYALTYVKSPADMAAWFYSASNVPYVVYVNGLLVDQRIFGSGSWKFDEDRIEITLREGVNRILVKYAVSNGAIHGGGRLVSVGGMPIPELEFTTANLEAEMPKIEKPVTTQTLYNEEVDGGRNWYASWRVTAGSFVGKEKNIYPLGSEKTGRWLPQSPDWGDLQLRTCNIAWLKPKKVPNSPNFALSCTLGTASAAHAITHFMADGEGEDDPYSGISIGVLRHYANWGGFIAIYKYNMPLFVCPLTAVPAAASEPFEIVRRDNYYWVTINNVVIFKGLGVAPLHGKWPYGICSVDGVSISKFLISEVE